MSFESLQRMQEKIKEHINKDNNEIPKKVTLNSMIDRNQTFSTYDIDQVLHTPELDT